eukprot:m.201613 g.201613  ORF g.201613 m.201613 type:complete len:362 (-) comp15348_c0_seq2:765-1850(-)
MQTPYVHRAIISRTTAPYSDCHAHAADRVVVQKAAIDSNSLVATVNEEALVEFRTPPIFPGARKVHIQPNVNMISEINILDSTFRVDLDIEMMWKVDSIDEDWDPHIEVINLADSTDVSGIDAAREKKMIDGSSYISKEVTFMLNCQQYMDIRDFPFDAHTLKFIVRSQDQPLTELQFARAFDDCDHESIRMHEYVLTDTRLVVDEMTYDHVIATEGADRARYSEFRIEIDVIRRYGYYYVKVVCASRWIDPGGRLWMLRLLFCHPTTSPGSRCRPCTLAARHAGCGFLLGAGGRRKSACNLRHYGSHRNLVFVRRWQFHAEIGIGNTPRQAIALGFDNSRSRLYRERGRVCAGQEIPRFL